MARELRPFVSKLSTLFTMVLGGVACTTVYPIGRVPSEDELRRVAAVGEGRTVTITFVPKRAMAVEGISSEGTRLRWTLPEPGSAAWSDVREAAIVRRDVGFLQGAGVGAIAGFVIGGSVGLIAGVSCRPSPGTLEDPPGNCPLGTSPGVGEGLRAGLLLGLMAAVPAAVLGGVIGLAHGSRTVFTNDTPKSSDSR